MVAEGRGSRRVQSVERAFALLEAIASSTDGARLSDIAEQVGLHRSTTFNLLATLEDMGYITQPQRGGRYLLTDELTEMARGATGGDEWLRSRVRPMLDELARSTGETCYLAVVTGDECLYLDVAEGRNPLRVAVPAGTREPLLGTAVGHVLLANRPKAAERVARRQPIAWAEWEEQIELARELGYALDLERARPDLRSVAVPVRHGELAPAAVGVTGPASRLVDDRLRELAELMQRGLRAVTA